MFRQEFDYFGGGVEQPEVLPDRLPARHSLTKRALDFAGALLLIIVLFPVLAIVGLAVRLTSPGPVIYAQFRVGRDGKQFRFYKFRSMRTDADAVLNSFLDSDPEAKRQWEDFQKLDPDPRITPVGRFLRESSLDELPQLWNVLKGEMSLVGPRPVLPTERVRYGHYWESYCAVRPGLTGLWQVSGRSQVSYEKRVRLDDSYVRQWTFWLDLWILLRTVKVVALREGSK